jgi:hypothetical protein
MTSVRCKFRPSLKLMAAAVAVPETSSEPAPRARVARGAQMLAMAHQVERLVESGDVPSYAHAARALGLTRARLTQLMNLLLLSPAVQGRVLAGEIGATERSLRRLVGEPNWAAQDEHLRTLGTVPAGRQGTSTKTGKPT